MDSVLFTNSKITPVYSRLKQPSKVVSNPDNAGNKTKDDTALTNSLSALSILGKSAVHKYEPNNNIATEKLSSSEKTEEIENITPVSTADEKIPDCLPKYIYHITSKENLKAIQDSKKITFSTWEQGDYSLKGIYTVSRDNFLKHWIGRKEPDLSGDMDLGRCLLKWTCKAEDMCVIKIPTANLDLSKLRFRPYIETCYEIIESYQNEEPAPDIVSKGLPLSELPKYIDKGPVEFVYTDEIPCEKFSDITKFEYNCTPEQIDEYIDSNSDEITKQLFPEEPDEDN